MDPMKTEVIVRSWNNKLKRDKNNGSLLVFLPKVHNDYNRMQNYLPCVSRPPKLTNLNRIFETKFPLRTLMLTACASAKAQCVLVDPSKTSKHFRESGGKETYP